MNETEVRQIVENFISAQISNPLLLGGKSECIAVWQRLIDNGYTEVAGRYLDWACRSASKDEDYDEFGEKAFKLQKILNSIEHNFVMPSWGTYGT